jgi:hypothetical protein
MARTPRRPLRPGWHGQHTFKPNAKVVTDVELRRIFANDRILERAQRGELTVEVDPDRDGHPSPPRANEPECTRSQIVVYRTPQGEKIAEAHRYVRPDGTLGASHLPDPKEIVHEGILYYLDIR